MNNLFLVGDPILTSKYISEFIKKNNFTNFDIITYNERIKIEDARIIKKSLGYKISSKKLYLFLGDITAEAQNSLLKNVEEANDYIYFIFVSRNEDSLLPTLRSRCLVVKLHSDIKAYEPTYSIVKSACENKDNWSMLDEIYTSLGDRDLAEIVPVLRQLMLERTQYDDISSYYYYCKKILCLLPLVQKNNVNSRIVIESVFL